MKSLSALLPCVLALLVAVSCDYFKEASHDTIMRAKIAKLDLVEHQFTLDRESRLKKAKEIAAELSKEYPAAMPFGKDSTDRIFRSKVPPKIHGMPFQSKEVTYEKAKIAYPELEAVYGTKSVNKQPYYVGMVKYGIKTKGKKGGRGSVLVISDAGGLPEWLIATMYDRLNRGENSSFFGQYAYQFEFDRILDYKGHTWAVWTPRGGYKSFLEKKKETLRLFTTHWNSRFMIYQLDVDTAAHNLETFYQVVDVDWLDKLRSPDRQKHVMPD